MTNSIVEFIRHLTNLSINLETDGVSGAPPEELRLRCHAPEGALTPTLRQEIAARKKEIILFLQQAKQVKNTHQLTIQPVSRDDKLPLSFAQQRLWFLHQMSPDSCSYNMLLILRLDGSLNILALEQSLSELVRRHEILRTTFPSVDGNPIQLIAPPTALTLPIHDLQWLSDEEQTDRIQQIAKSLASQPFDLAVGPLVQFALIQLCNQEYVLLLKMHHIIYDGWSLEIFQRELSQLYTAFTQGLPNPLAQLSIQYADFAVWQRQWLIGEVLDRQLNYWQQQLAGVSGVLELPSDRPRPRVQSFRGGVERFQLDRDLTQRLKQLSQESDTTLFMTLLAAFLVLLSRYSGQSDIVVGSPIANRNSKSVEQLMGFFANTLALRGNLSDNPSFADFLAQVRQTTFSAYAHQDLPFEMLVEKLQPERDLSRNPLVQVMFSLQNAPQSSWNLPGLTIENMSLPLDEAVKFDLDVGYWEVSEGLEGIWSYSADLFDATTITRIAQHFQTLLQAIVANPRAGVAELPLLTQAERHQLLVEWNDTQTNYPQDKCIHQLFEEQVERSPNAIAVVYENQQLTYYELNYRANQLAHYLQTLGVKPDVLVGLCVERSLEMVVGLLGILKAGGAYVPLDPNYPQERLSFMLEDAQVPVLLTHHHLIERLPEHRANLVCLDTDWLLICESSQDNALAQLTVGIAAVQAVNLAYVIYTSGSTGQPKGVMLSHRNLCNHMFWMQTAFPLTEKDKVLQKTPFSFDASVWEFYAPLLVGGQLLLAQPGGHADTAYLKELIAKEQVTTVQFVPSLLQILIEQGGLETCRSLKQIFCGGEALPVVVQENLLSNLNVNLHNLYGPTEACIDATFWTCKPGIKRQIVPIGRPIANTQIYILDEYLQPVPVGVPGELHISGAGLARSYLNRPELTQEKFIPNPFYNSKFTEQNSKLYKTGDKARYLPDGTIEYLGRIDNQVKIRGFRIELGEIEARLSQYEDVQACCVIAREDTPGDKRLVTYVVPHQHSLPTINELRQFLKAKLPEYMVPSAFVMLESLPLTPNGKIDRRALPAPDLQSDCTDKYVAPRSPIEELLAQTWAQVLKVEQVGIYDNFFELGGHSLLATQVVSRIRNIFKVELPLRELFGAATVAQLAYLIGQLQQQNLELSAPPILRRAENAELALSYAQQRLWFLDQFEPNSPFYNMPIALRLAGTVQVVALEQSLQEIIARHEALRTNFITVDGQPTQIIQTESTWTLSVVDLKHLSTSEQEIVTQQLAQQQAIQPFDLVTEALVRATLVVLSETEHILLMCMHHIVFDGWSMSVFVQELAILYNAYSQGQPSPLRPLPIQYVDFALWQRQWLQGEVLQSQLSYWEQQLKDAPALLSLPTDRPRPAVQTYNGTLKKFALSLELSSKLAKLSQEQGVTLFMTLLAAFDTLLYRYTDTEDILVGSPIANRDRSEIEELIGFFVNTLVLRTDLAGNPSFCELLSRVRKVALSAYAHQNLPFEMLVEALQPKRDLSYTPLFQVMFALQNASTSEVELTGLTVTRLLPEGATARFDLSLLMQNTATGLVGFWEYNTDLFDASTIERITGHFLTLLEGIIANPEQQISQLPLLTAVEQQQLLVEWNDTQADYPSDKCINQLFEEQVQRTPDAIAVVFEDQQLTYQQLNCRANQLSHYLKSLGVGADVLVGICVERSIEMVVGLLGILKAGGAYVPLDPNYPQERLAFMLEDAQISVLLTQQSLVDRLPEHQAKLVCLDTDARLFSQSSQENLISGVQVNNLAYVIYTSGSTGQPKGVALNQLGLCNLILWQLQNTPISTGAKTLQFAPISFDVSFQEIFTTWFSGGALFLITEELRREPVALLGFLEEKAIERLFVPFVALQQLAEVAVDSKLVNSHLREIITAGERLQITPAISQWFSKLGDCILHNHYGPSETHAATTFTLTNSVDTWPLLPPIGQPIANAKIYILDKYLQPVPIGVPGELYIGSVCLARGYLNRPELTQEKFISNPFEKLGESKLYKTGDLARYLPDGNIEYLGRIDNQVKIRGFRIELGEVEAALSQHSDVQACCVIPREDTPGDKRLVAYLVANQDCRPTISELRQFLKAKLPEYMVPNVFVMLESLPLTPSGKVDRRTLPVPDLYSEITDKYVAPRTPIEELLAQMWAQVLKVEAVGIYDNFFELGGHSLLATQLVSRIRNIFKVELPLRELFATATLGELALVIEQLQQQNLQLSAPPILPRAKNTDLPLSFAQQRLWFLDQLQPLSAFYNIPVAFRLVGTLNVAALQQSLQEIVHRHEALRTNFVTVDGQPTQVIQTQGNWKVSIVDFKYLSTTEQEIATQQLAQQQAIQPFNLATEPLIRATLIVLSETEHALLVGMHHIVFDGWSVGVFVQELGALYNAYSQGQPSPLAPLPIQYADFAIWQRNWLQGDVLQSQLSYWQQQLANAPALLSLPTDRPRPSVQTFAGAYQQFALPTELTDRLVKLSQEQNCTLFMTLLAAYDTLLYRYTGVADILVGSPIANRDRSEIEGLIGFFVNTLVMRSNLAGNPTFSELLSRVQEVALSAYAHQNLPFEILVEALQPERDLSHTPLFQVMFAIQNGSPSEVELAGLTVTPLITEGATAKFDLSLLMQNTATGLVGFWEYNTDLFDASTIERMTGHFLTLLEGIIANPEQQISQLPLLTPVEQQQLLVEWNDTQVDYPSDNCIHQLFEKQVERTPDGVAVVFEEQQLTYQQLNSRANQLAHYLKSLGVGADVLVGICVERSIEMVVGLLGILKAGGAYVPLDPEYPTERLRFMLDDAQVPVLLTQHSLLEGLAQHQAQLVCLDTDWQMISQLNQDNLITETQTTNLAYVIYTSGSTGTPKGVMIAHQSLLNLVFWHQRTFKIISSDKATQLAKTAFDAAVWELWPYLTTGASIYLVKPEILSSLVKLRDWLISNKITISFLPTPLAQELLSLEWPAEGLALRTILTGGDKLHQYPSDLIPFQVVNNYGPTENTVVTTSGVVVAKEPNKISPNIGRAIANTQVYILDSNLQPVPVGVPGELHIAGVGLAKGYLNRPELITEKFISNPFEETEGSKLLYKTGDLARYLPDGNIEYLGRIDNQVKIRGFRIELGEIEALLGQHDDVQICCVVAREETQGNKCLVAYVVLQKEVTPTTDELRQFLFDKLPGYMVPNVFVMLESLPLTPNGKVDRRALPAPDLQQELSDYVMPNTEVERTIAGIWQKALAIEKVGIYNNFFELGGNSLLLVKINQQLQEELGLELSIVDMFNYPTIYSLSQYLNIKFHKKDTIKQNPSRTQCYNNKVKDLKNKQLQSRQQYRSQKKGKK